MYLIVVILIIKTRQEKGERSNALCCLPAKSRRVVRNLKWDEAVTGSGAEHQAVKNFVFFWQNLLNFGPILMKMNAINTWYRN